MRRIRPPLAENFAAAEGIRPTMVWSCGAEGQVPRFARAMTSDSRREVRYRASHLVPWRDSDLRE